MNKCSICGGDAEYQLKNGKWYCCENPRKCPGVKEKFKARAQQRWDQLKEEGIYTTLTNVEKTSYEPNKCWYCGEYADYQLANGKWCCENTHTKCKGYRKKLSDSAKKRIADLKVQGKYKSSYGMSGKVSWSKGLTKETNESLKRASEKHKINLEANGHNWKGRKHSDESKRKISLSRKKYLEEHPDQVPYLLNHSSKISYPERYFRKVFKDENIDLKHHLQVSKYQLDFYNLEKKIYVEIDGESHYVDKKTVAIDKERTKFLDEQGWQGYRVRWSLYKKLAFEERKEEIAKIKCLLNTTEFK